MDLIDWTTTLEFLANSSRQQSKLELMRHRVSFSFVFVFDELDHSDRWSQCLSWNQWEKLATAEEATLTSRG